MNREHQRRGQGGQEQVGTLVAVPVADRSPPPQGKDAVGDRAEPRRRPVAERGQIGDHAHVPEEKRDGEVGPHRKEVPNQGAPELRPHLHLVGDRDRPVQHPHPPHVDSGEHEGADDGEDRHRFGEAVDRGPPFLAEEIEDRADQGARVADPDPEDEVDDRKPPHHRVLVAPHPHAGGEEIQDHHAQDAGKEERDRKGDVPRPRGPAGLVDPADLLGDGTELVVAQDQRRPASRIVKRVVNRQRGHPACVEVGDAIRSGIGFRSLARYVVRGLVLISSSIS